MVAAAAATGAAWTTHDGVLGRRALARNVVDGKFDQGAVIETVRSQAEAGKHDDQQRQRQRHRVAHQPFAGTQAAVGQARRSSDARDRDGGMVIFFRGRPPPAAASEDRQHMLLAGGQKKEGLRMCRERSSAHRPSLRLFVDRVVHHHQTTRKARRDTRDGNGNFECESVRRLLVF